MRSLPTPDGLDLAVHELGGQADGGPAAGTRPTLLCHATGFHGAVWEPLAAALGDGFARWAVDFRAHGATPVPDGAALDWQGFANDVLAAVDGLDLPRGETLGVGHSMGGAALVLAELARPGTFVGLWLFEPVIPPVGRLPGGAGNPLAASARRRRDTFRSRAEAIENFASKPPFDRVRADALHAYVRHGFVPGEEGGVRLACRPEHEAGIYETAANHGAFARLSEVACPVVVAVGEEPSGPASFAPAVAGALPAGRLERHEHLGHFGPLEAPDHLAAAIAAFAATI